MRTGWPTSPTPSIGIWTLPFTSSDQLLRPMPCHASVPPTGQLWTPPLPTASETHPDLLMSNTPKLVGPLRFFLQSLNSFCNLNCMSVHMVLPFYEHLFASSLPLWITSLMPDLLLDSGYHAIKACWEWHRDSPTYDKSTFAVFHLGLKSSFCHYGMTIYSLTRGELQAQLMWMFHICKQLTGNKHKFRTVDFPHGSSSRSLSCKFYLCLTFSWFACSWSRPAFGRFHKSTANPTKLHNQYPGTNWHFQWSSEMHAQYNCGNCCQWACYMQSTRYYK